MKEVLYIHGYNSSGSTGRTLEKLCDFTKVHHFPIPVNPDEAIEKVNKYLSKHPEISLIVGSSLGGFITSQITGYMKLMINPCMVPQVELPKLGCNKEIADLYTKYNMTSKSVDHEDRASTMLLFGTKDELFSYKKMCTYIYGNKNIGSMEGVKHHLTEDDLKEFVVPKIKYMLTDFSKQLFEHFENM